MLVAAPPRSCVIRSAESAKRRFRFASTHLLQTLLWYRYSILHCANRPFPEIKTNYGNGFVLVLVQIIIVQLIMHGIELHTHNEVLTLLFVRLFKCDELIINICFDFMLERRCQLIATEFWFLLKLFLEWNYEFSKLFPAKIIHANAVPVQWLHFWFSGGVSRVQFHWHIEHRWATSALWQHISSHSLCAISNCSPQPSPVFTIENQSINQSSFIASKSNQTYHKHRFRFWQCVSVEHFHICFQILQQISGAYFLTIDRFDD